MERDVLLNRLRGYAALFATLLDCQEALRLTQSAYRRLPQYAALPDVPPVALRKNTFSIIAIIILFFATVLVIVGGSMLGLFNITMRAYFTPGGDAFRQITLNPLSLVFFTLISSRSAAFSYAVAEAGPADLYFFEAAARMGPPVTIITLALPLVVPILVRIGWSFHIRNQNRKLMQQHQAKHGINEIFIKQNKKNDEANADIVRENATLQAREQAIKEEIAHIQSKIDEMLAGWYPPKYQTMDALLFFISAFENFEADTMSEAVKLYKDELERRMA